MTTFRTATVIEVLEVLDGIERYRVAMADGTNARAYALVEVIGPGAVGDEVVCNTTAVELGLGTGGWHVVHWNLSRREWQRPGPDHVMKMRYTSLQIDVGTSELVHPDVPLSLAGIPVVVCQVHSQVGVVAAAIGALRPGTRVAYVMTDGAALPIALSDLVRQLRQRGLLDTTVTAGNAFGGDLEAVTVASALTLAAGPGDAEVIIVGMGPGVVGTGTAYGTTAIEAASTIDTVDALGGTPVFCVRASSGDARERHRGVSHHSLTAIRLAHARPLVALPPDLGQLSGTEPVAVPVPPIDSILADVALRITTMGRSIDDDRLFFDTAACAAAVAVARLDAATSNI
ncbi:MAG: DUF3866 family protein [Actinobacteria bacterium]|nr:DUF3866 family protein [Actinomycetota bacterium]